MVEWSSSEISNSHHQHVTSVWAKVSGDAPDGNVFTAKLNFQSNQDTGTICIDCFELNSREMDVNVGSKSIIT